METYLAVGEHDWCWHIYTSNLRKIPGDWHYFYGDPKHLKAEIERLQPRYVFFLHWSHYVPTDVTDNYECVCIHPSHLPYGRGGTPVQNLIQYGWTTTKVSAFRMTDEIDAGPIYLQEDLDLSGRAEEIYNRIMWQAAYMIRRIIKERIEPVPQEGIPRGFIRRVPEESELPDCHTINELYDFMRMLDAEDYPHAFLLRRGFRYEFSNINFDVSKITATVKITKEG